MNQNNGYITGQNLIIISASDKWNGPWKGRHQIISRLLPKNKVLFIEEPRYSIFTILKDKKRLSRLWSWTYIRRPQTNLILYTPILALPFGDKSRTINSINNFILYINLWILIKLIKFKPSILYLSYYTHELLISLFRQIPSIYNAHDVWEVYQYNLKMREFHKKLEEDTIRSVNLAVFTAKQNMVRKSHLNKNCFYVPHGCPLPPDWLLKGKMPQRPKDLPDDGRPIMGYWGTIDKGSVDIKLITSLAERRKDWNFVFIGPIHKPEEKLFYEMAIKNNIFFFDRKPIVQRYEYLCYFNVGLLCATMIEMEIMGSQLKIWEYISAGIPIVSIPVEEYLGFKDFVYIASNVDEWELMLAKALNIKNENKLDRLNFATRNTWESRVKILSELFSKHLITKQ